MSEKPQAASSGKLRIAIIALSAIVFLAVFIRLTTPTVLRSRKDPVLIEFYKLSGLGQALAEFAGCNDGNFPAKFEDLGISVSGFNASPGYTDPRTGRSGHWVYFPSYVSSDRPDTILVASPSTISRSDGTYMVPEGIFRMVLSLDGRARFLIDADYQMCIREQSNEDWRKRPREMREDPWRFLSNPVWNASSPGKIIPGTASSTGDIQKRTDALKHGSDTERWNAADELGQMEQVSPEITSALLEALGDSEAGYLSGQGLAVMSLRDPSIISRIVQIMRSGSSRKSSYWAAVALEQIGLERAPEAIPLMTEALGRKGDEIQITAAKAVAGAGPAAAEAVPQLMRAIADGDSWTRKCAVIALGRIGPQAAAAIPILTEMFDARQDFTVDVARALWKIDPIHSVKFVPFLIRAVENQRIPGGPNHPMDNDFYSAIDLLGEMGPNARAAIPILQLNLQGGARVSVAWSLWQIDASQAENLVPLLAECLNRSPSSGDRLDRLAKGRRPISIGEPQGSGISKSSGLKACGMLWQIHPEKRESLTPVLTTLLREWQEVKDLSECPTALRSAIPALEDLLEKPLPADVRNFAAEARQEFKTLDPGRW